MDPEVFHERFTQSIRQKDNSTFLTLLPKIATRNKQWRDKYFYMAGCEGTAVMVEQLMHNVQPNYRLIMDTLYDALNYNNTETIQVLAPYIATDVSDMVAGHIGMTRKLNMQSIQMVANYMTNFESVVFKTAQKPYDTTDKLAHIWDFIEPHRFFEDYSLVHLQLIGAQSNRRFLMAQYDIFVAETQKNVLQQHVNIDHAQSKRKM